MLELLEKIKVLHEAKIKLGNRSYLCVAAYDVAGRKGQVQFKEYLVDNYPSVYDYKLSGLAKSVSCFMTYESVVWRNDFDRLHWLNKQIKLEKNV